jgi:hypothetical protein
MGQDGSMPARRPSVVSVVLVTLVVAWGACMVVPPVLLLRNREAWLAELRRDDAQADWDAFRRDMRAESGRDGPVSGPVKRKEPRSAEPPLLVWLRDYVALAIGAWVLFGSVLFAFLGLAILGLLPQDQPRGGGDREEEHQGDGEHAQQ